MNIKELPLTTAEHAAGFKLFCLENSGGCRITICNYGAIISSITVPDKRGVFDDIVLGYDDLLQYREDQNYFGALVGPCANRIANADLPLGNRRYRLDANAGIHHLHGGLGGLSLKFWSARIIEDGDPGSAAIVLRCVSPHGEAGYPGNTSFQVTYRLNDANELSMEYRARTDRTTVVNLTQHSYFNLAGVTARPLSSVLNHMLRINADTITVVDEALIPTGEFLSVADTPFDFRTPKPIGTHIRSTHPLIRAGNGFDHNWVVAADAPENGSGARCIAEVWEPLSGRTLTVYSDQPGVQFYTANHLSQIVGKADQPYFSHSGFCLETQHFPDAPHRPEFDNILLHPGDLYRSTTVYRFGVKN